MRLIHLLWCLVFIGCWQFTFADQLSILQDNVIAPDLLFERFTSKNGLPDDRIRAFYQDSHGFLWIGTMNGLSRYDGYSFKRYAKSTQTNSIVGNWTYAICEDTRHTLWIGTKEGLSHFNPQTETFTNYRNDPTNPESLCSNQINTLLYDSRGQLWIGTPKGLNLFNPVTGKFRRFTQYPFNTVISRLIRSTGDFIWIATTDGPVRYNVRTGQYRHYPLAVRGNPYGDRFWSLLEDSQHHLYLGTGGDGLFRLRFDPERNAYSGFDNLNTRAGNAQALYHTEVFDIRQTRSGSLWLGTDRGLMRLDKPGTPSAELHQYIHNPLSEKSISNDRIYTLFIDRTNVLWCGTERGMNKLDLHLQPFRYFTFASQRAFDQVRSILSTDGQSIWLGTAKSGFYHYDLLTKTTRSYRFQPDSSFRNHHRSIFLDANKNLLLGTLGGAIQLKAGSYKEAKSQLDGVAVFAFLQDSRKTIWIGTNNGLYTIGTDGTRTHFPFRPGRTGEGRGEFVRSLYEDHTGAIWVGYENIGVYRFNPKTNQFTHIQGNQTSERLIGSTVYAILEQPRNVFWIGTESGLNKVNLTDAGKAGLRVRVKTYQDAAGLPDQSVNGILADRRGNLWISTIKGLARFNPQTEQVQVFLPTLAFTHSCQYDATGNKLLFGAYDGFVLFDPDQIETDASVPKLVLSDLRIFNQEVSIGAVFNGDTVLTRSLTNSQQLTLNYRNNGFTIGFAGLHLSNPDQNHYAYRLAGFDKNWVPTSAQNRSATYTNLDAGTYTFWVKAANSSGVWNEGTTLLTITILPPPWKTWWAIGLYLLAFNGLLFLFIRYLLAQSRQRQQLRFEQMEQAQIQTLNQLKLRFFTDVSHEFRTPLSLIVAPVEDLLAATDLPGVVRQKMQLIQHNCQKLLHLIDELMTFQKLEQGMLKLNPKPLELVAFVKDVCANFTFMAHKKGIRLLCTADIDWLPMMADADKLEKILNNLISNALKFTPTGGTVQVIISKTTQAIAETPAEWVCLRVEDTGIGIPAEALTHLFERFYQANSTKPGTGVGLSLTKSLVELHGGTISAESEPGLRTCFSLLLPLLSAPDGSVAEQLPVAHLEPEVWTAQTTDLLPLPSAPALVNDKCPELLIVDDNSEILDYLELAFNGTYQVRRAVNGRQALELVRQQEPDVIISDIMMPEMDGITLCRTLKNDLATCHIPLILLTARSTVEQKIEGIGTGADDYMPKPFHPGLLRVRIEKLIEFRQRLLAKFRTAPVLVPKDLTRNPLDEAFLQKVIDIIKENLSNDEFSVEELGNFVNMSRSNLFRKLKAITGQTPVEFIYQVRLKHGLKLLLEQKLNISEITYEVGFKSPSSFSKSFRRQFGKAPTEYLSDLRNTQEDNRLMH